MLTSAPGAAPLALLPVTLEVWLLPAAAPSVLPTPAAVIVVERRVARVEEDGVVVTGVAAVVVVSCPGKTVELVEVRLVPVLVLLVVELDPPALTPFGGGLARLGFVKAPIPHGIASPFGWSAFAGAVVVPVVVAIANRVVQRRLPGSAGSENW